MPREGASLAGQLACGTWPGLAECCLGGGTARPQPPDRLLQTDRAGSATTAPQPSAGAAVSCPPHHVVGGVVQELGARVALHVVAVVVAPAQLHSARGRVGQGESRLVRLGQGTARLWLEPACQPCVSSQCSSTTAAAAAQPARHPPARPPSTCCWASGQTRRWCRP